MRKYFYLIFLAIVLVGCGQARETEGTGNSPLAGTVPLATAIQLPSPTPVVVITTPPTTMRIAKWAAMDGSTFTTKYNVKDKNRVNNLEVATKILNDLEVAPDGVFSFNEHIGVATAEKGYLPSVILRDGKEEEGLGGGICQLSTGIFNAAEQAGLEIVERHPHSKRVYYVDEGRDAATSVGGKDFKFKNTTPHPVRIKISMNEGELTVNLENYK